MARYEKIRRKEEVFAKWKAGLNRLSAKITMPRSIDEHVTFQIDGILLSWGRRKKLITLNHDTGIVILTREKKKQEYRRTEMRKLDGSSEWKASYECNTLHDSVIIQKSRYLWAEIRVRSRVKKTSGMYHNAIPRDDSRRKEEVLGWVKGGIGKINDEIITRALRCTCTSYFSLSPSLVAT